MVWVGVDMVGQPHEPKRVDQLRRGDQVAEAAAREGERLAHGPGHDQPRVVGEQRQGARRARPGELRAGLVDDDDGVGSRGKDGADDVERQRGARRVVRRAEEDDRRVVLAGLCRGRSGGEIEGLRLAEAVDPRRAERLGDDGVHRVARREAECGAPGPERLHEV